jgi:hypothetical protein
MENCVLRRAGLTRGNIIVIPRAQGKSSLICRGLWEMCTGDGQCRTTAHSLRISTRKRATIRTRLDLVEYTLFTVRSHHYGTGQGGRESRWEIQEVSSGWPSFPPGHKSRMDGLFQWARIRLGFSISMASICVLVTPLRVNSGTTFSSMCAYPYPPYFTR